MMRWSEDEKDSTLVRMSESDGGGDENGGIEENGGIDDNEN